MKNLHKIETNILPYSKHVLRKLAILSFAHGKRKVRYTKGKRYQYWQPTWLYWDEAYWTDFDFKVYEEEWVRAGKPNMREYIVGPDEKL